jgi:hypothetical protein
VLDAGATGGGRGAAEPGRLHDQAGSREQIRRLVDTISPVVMMIAIVDQPQ